MIKAGYREVGLVAKQCAPQQRRLQRCAAAAAGKHRAEPHLERGVQQVHHAEQLLLAGGRVLGQQVQHGALAPVAELPEAGQQVVDDGLQWWLRETQREAYWLCETQRAGQRGSGVAEGGAEQNGATPGGGRGACSCKRIIKAMGS